MIATGIILRVDDLGRVVIPREIRRTMHIHEGDPLEIFTENGSVVFRKYNPAETVLDSARTLLSEIAETEDLKCREELLRKISDLVAILQEQEETAADASEKG